MSKKKGIRNPQRLSASFRANQYVSDLMDYAGIFVEYTANRQGLSGEDFMEEAKTITFKALVEKYHFLRRPNELMDSFVLGFSPDNPVADIDLAFHQASAIYTGETSAHYANIEFKPVYGSKPQSYARALTGSPPVVSYGTDLQWTTNRQNGLFTTFVVQFDDEALDRDEDPIKGLRIFWPGWNPIQSEEEFDGIDSEIFANIIRKWERYARENADGLNAQQWGLWNKLRLSNKPSPPHLMGFVQDMEVFFDPETGFARSIGAIEEITNDKVQVNLHAGSKHISWETLLENFFEFYCVPTLSYKMISEWD